MMKVICIKKDKWVWKFVDRGDRPKDPVFGEECEVIDSINVLGIMAYQLAGYENLYTAIRFVPLSSIDETEFIRNYNKELALCAS